MSPAQPAAGQGGRASTSLGPVVPGSRAVVADEFGRLLRSFRDRADAPWTEALHSRRAPGLRREELAQAASVSVDYVIRLEQGRSLRPSAAVVDAFARALGLSREETSTLYLAAGLAPPSRAVVRELGDGLRRFLDRVGGVAAAVYSADWWLLGWNQLWSDLLGDPSGYTGYGRNLVWQVFTHDNWRPVPRDRSLTQFRQSLANDLRSELVDYPDDMHLSQLVEALAEASKDFAHAWARSTAGRQPSERKTLRHPQAGDLWLHTDVFQLRGDDQHLVLYSADPDSHAALALEHLG